MLSNRSRTEWNVSPDAPGRVWNWTRDAGLKKQTDFLFIKEQLHQQTDDITSQSLTHQCWQTQVFWPADGPDVHINGKLSERIFQPWVLPERFITDISLFFFNEVTWINNSSSVLPSVNLAFAFDVEWGQSDSCSVDDSDLDHNSGLNFKHPASLSQKSGSWVVTWQTWKNGHNSQTNGQSFRTSLDFWGSVSGSWNKCKFWEMLYGSLTTIQ